MKLKDLLDVELLNTHLLNRVVSEQSHPEHHNIVIYNYTHVAQHENVWDSVTEQCRGLIVDKSTGDVLARPFMKFFNLNTSFRPETMEENLPTHKPRVLEKLDGSLGILYTYAGIPYIATRGSFASDQANWATQWYQEHRTKCFRGNYEIPDPKQITWPEGYTPLFEIIYKENRIVVSYEYEGLVLLGLVNIDTGFELSPEEVEDWGSKGGFRTAQEYTQSLADCKSDKSSNIEGFVLQYWNSKAPIPLRIKIKTEDYVRLHKVITGLNPKGIWEHLSQGHDPQALWLPAATNPQFIGWCIGWITMFQKEYKKLEEQAIMAFGRCSLSAKVSCVNICEAKAIRKCYAMAIQKEATNLYSALFLMLDGRDYRPALWALLEPKIQKNQVFMQNGDEFNGL